jgi:hypothetical protein
MLSFRLGFPAFVANIPYRHYSPTEILRINRTIGTDPIVSSKHSRDENDYVDVNFTESDGLAFSFTTNSSCLSTKTLEDVYQWCENSISQSVFALLKVAGQRHHRVCSLAEAWDQRGVEIIYCVKDVHGMFSSITEYTPGWGTRNLLAFLAHSGVGQIVDDNGGGRIVQVLCVQGSPPPHTSPSSTTSSFNIGSLYFPLLTILLPTGCLDSQKDDNSDNKSNNSLPKVMGWQPNERGKPGPRVLDAAIVMDTKRIMEQVYQS